MNKFDENTRVKAYWITEKTLPESNSSNGFASKGTAVLSSPRLLPLEASERFFRALRMTAFERSWFR